MIHTIRSRNAHAALPEALRLLQTSGREEDTRNGPVLRLPGLTVFEYLMPEERVVLWGERDANPFFHLFESLWMLAGHNDVKYVSQFSKNIKNYSDDGKTFHGAYGFRWRKWFQIDQVNKIIELLKENPADRRCYLQMWDAQSDLGREGKDFPCNVGATFSMNDGRLDMVVHNRSNDLVWGALGANCVHFSVLQEYIAACIGVEIGVYHQVSSNMHGYLSTAKPLMEKMSHLADDGYRTAPMDPYTAGMRPFPLMSVPKEIWDQDLQMFMNNGPKIGLRDPFFRTVAGPLMHAYNHLKGTSPDRHEEALDIAQQCAAVDWRAAALQWIQRRHDEFKRKQETQS